MSTFAAGSQTAPTWLALVGAIGLGTVLSALITAGSLIYQNRQNAEREERRRKQEVEEREKDRGHEQAARLETRRQELDDVWRDERRETHVALLAMLTKGLTDLEREAERALDSGHLTIDHAETDQSGFVSRLQPSQIDELTRLVEHVSLIASEHTYAEAGVSFNALIDTNERLLGLSGFTVTEDDIDLFYESAAESRAFIHLYRRAIRVDLGTV